MKIAAKIVNVDSKKRGVPWQCLALNELRLNLVEGAEKYHWIEEQKAEKESDEQSSEEKKFSFNSSGFFHRKKMKMAKSEFEEKTPSNKKGNRS
ncbi:hypothetical protein AYM02_09945 [Coxiella burnetii]|uniref:hypothetical protein n=1 Tax=Coxiella burnetii TaxID=777 RepID=UPI0000DAEB21|nr:hypothetical protein [Coxiella burnetii]ABX77423.1 hypothetical protein COXBURSA331_A0577 [Coxiella burnetii RSA 331]AIT63630.1 hypothetical protein CBNA_1384 [Coxiella burnetii str. Namibia]AML49598.1 hypothetical protein AUR58_10825 [Coxiella burnetii]AML55504.1 hypothetical protein AYM38_09810 [Coxiella burnetii]ARI65348.1 hypothetical protein B7L74_02415 [Coxiella burnetii]